MTQWMPLALVALLLGGCVLVPYPATGPQLTEAAVAPASLLGLTRQQVHARITTGMVALDDRREIVAGSSEDFWVMPVVMGQGGGRDVPIDQRRVLALVEYGPDARLVAATVHADPATTSDGTAATRRHRE